MRVTLTLDDEIAQKLVELARDSDASLEATVNNLLRRGLAQLARPFILRPHAGGLRKHFEDQCLNELAWEPEPSEGG